MESIIANSSVAQVRFTGGELFALQPCDPAAFPSSFRADRNGINKLADLYGDGSGFSALMIGKDEVHAVNIGAGAIFYFRKGVLLQQMEPNTLGVNGSYRPYFRQSPAKGDSILICDTVFLGNSDSVRVQIERCQSPDPETWLKRLNCAGRAAAVFIN